MKNSVLPEIFTIFANIASLLVAITALVLSFNIEERNSARFEQQLKQSENIAKASIKPLLSVASSGFIGIKLVALKNDGLGTAAIDKIEFERNGKTSAKLAELFSFEDKIIWNNFYSFAQSQFYLRAGQDVTLIHLTADSLKQQGFDENARDRILDSFDMQLSEITMKIEYQDLLGNEQTPLSFAL